MTRTVDWALPAAEAFAAEQPVSSAVGAALAASCNAAYEAIYNVQVPGNVAATIAGHGHTGTLAGGDPDGVAIPRQVLAWTGPIPEWLTGVSVASPTTYDYGDLDGFGTDGTDYVATNPRTCTASKCANIAYLNVMGVWRVHLRAGCNGVKNFIWVSFEDSGEDMQVYVDLLTSAGAILDHASHTFTGGGGDYNAAWMELPSVADAAVHGTGIFLATSGDATGDQITTDGDYFIRVCVVASGGVGAGKDGIVRLFGIDSYEVIP